MLLQPIDIFVLASLIVAVFSAAYVAWDQFYGQLGARGDEVGLRARHLVHGPNRSVAICDGRHGKTKTMVGYQRDALIGQTIETLIPECYRDRDVHH